MNRKHRLRLREMIMIVIKVQHKHLSSLIWQTLKEISMLLKLMTKNRNSLMKTCQLKTWMWESLRHSTEVCWSQSKTKTCPWSRLTTWRTTLLSTRAMSSDLTSDNPLSRKLASYSSKPAKMERLSIEFQPWKTTKSSVKLFVTIQGKFYSSGTWIAWTKFYTLP